MRAVTFTTPAALFAAVFGPQQHDAPVIDYRFNKRWAHFFATKDERHAGLMAFARELGRNGRERMAPAPFAEAAE